MITNNPLAERYMSYASKFGIHFPPRADQERIPGASTDEGDVSYEVPSLQPVYRIESKQANHNPEFTKAAGTEESHKRTMTVSKSLALVAVDYFLQDDFRKEVKKNFKNGTSG
jgi:metal-dependent amidase/aminoacylase/carboxypeptidase family protein